MRHLFLSAALLPLPAWAEIALLDTAGGSVVLPAPAARVVLLWDTFVQDMAALGVMPVGIPVGPEFGTDAGVVGEYLAALGLDFGGAGLPANVTHADWSTDWEQVARLTPDLILGGAPEDMDVAREIAPALRLELMGADGRDDPALARAAFLTLGEALGRREAAMAALARIEARVAAYEALAPGDQDALLIYYAGGDSIGLLGPASLTCQMWARIGDCAAPGADTDYWSEVTVEALLAADPDMVMVMTGCYGTGCADHNRAILAELGALPLWGELSAARDGRVHPLPYDARAYTVGTWGLFLDLTAPLLYPETFPSPLTDAQVAAALQE